MMLIEETPILDAALPVEAFKAHLRLGTGFGEDDVQEAGLASFLRAAIAAVEGRTGKALLARSFSASVTEWRNCEACVLPIAPVNAIEAVTQIARDGTRIETGASVYWLERDTHAPRLRATAGSLPRVPHGGSVEIRFEAGLAPDWDSVPADLRQATLMLAAHYYEYRNDTGLSDGCMPFGVSSLIARHTHIRLGGGAQR